MLEEPRIDDTPAGGYPGVTAHVGELAAGRWPAIITFGSMTAAAIAWLTIANPAVALDVLGIVVLAIACWRYRAALRSSSSAGN